MDGGLEQPQIDEIEYLKLTDELKREMPDLLTDIKNPLDGFKKDEYEQAFLAYIKEHDDILREIEDVYVCSTNAKEGMQTLAQEFVEYVKTSLETETKKKKTLTEADGLQYDLSRLSVSGTFKTEPKIRRSLCKGIIAGVEAGVSKDKSAFSFL